MKSKFNFFGVCVLTCALVLSLFSCTKDLQDQIDKLTTDVAALQSAINSGKLVKSVNPVAGGYDIVFSDNSTIRINHGTNGTNGTPGTPGTPGAAGFTPIIGIDADGYWTVVASQGATPVRIKNASGNEVKASMSDNLTLVDNFLAVNGVKTTIYIPNIAYNATTRTLMIWAKNENGTSTMYNVPLADEIVLTTDIIGLVSPIGNTKVLIQYGSVPTTGNVASVLAWAGVTAGQSLGSDGVLPLIVNPSAAAIAGYTFEIIKADGTPYALQGVIEQGFDITKKFEQYTNPAAGGTNALYSIKLNPSLAEINAHMGTSVDKETRELAVRATKGTREIVSGYQYSIRVKKAIEQMVEPAAGVVKYVPTGTSVDVMTMFTNGVDPQSAANFYKVGLMYSTTLATNEDIKPYLSLTNSSSVITSAKGNHTVANLNGRPAFLTLMSYDFIGSYKTRPVELRYFTDLSASVPDAALLSHTLTASASPADQKVISLDPMFTALDAEGKTELWRNNANNVKLTVRTSTGTYIDVVPATLGISYEFLDLNNAVTVLPTAMRKIRFTFTEQTALPGDYTFRFQFGDAREGVAYPGGYPVADANTFKEFTFLIPVTVSNPAALPANSANLMIHTAGLWTGNDLSVFGPAGGQKLNPTAYDLAGAYSASLGAEPQANWAFMTTTTADNTAGLITASRMYLVKKGALATDYTTLYTPKQVKLRYFWFGNVNNYVDLETITVTAKSEIKEGALVNVQNTASNGTFVGEAGTGTTHTALTVVHGVTGTVGNPAKALKDYYRFNNYFGTDLKVFNVPIPATTSLVTEVKLELDAQYDNLLIIDPLTMTVASKVSPLAPITGDIVVPVKVRVKDVFGLWFEGTVNVTVKKP